MSEKEIKRVHRYIMFANLAVLVFILLLFFLGPLKLIRYKGIIEFKRKKSMSVVVKEQEESLAIVIDGSGPVRSRD